LGVGRDVSPFAEASLGPCSKLVTSTIVFSTQKSVLRGHAMKEVFVGNATHKSPEPGSPSRVQPDFGERETLFVSDQSGAYSVWSSRVEADRGI
jgi:hypothetical protein